VIAVAGLRLGPLLRYVDGSSATVWVEANRPCTAEVRCPGGAGGEARTFQVAGHHYAMVPVSGLPPDATTPYEVLLDGTPVWPLPDSAFPPSVIRTPDPDVVRVAFGSCRWAAPPADEKDPVGPDALDTLAARLAGSPGGERPDVLLLLGDQVYADETSKATRHWLAARRNLEDPPGDQVADYEEYTRLYYESWLDPEVRWLLSTVPSCMIFDDHDVIDDWNTSASWLADMRATPWWRERVLSGLMSYWVHQHLGNLSPSELAEDQLYAAVRETPDGTDVLRAYSAQADADPASVRWSYRRDFGRVRVLMLDTRAARVLDEGNRSMLDPGEAEWLQQQVWEGRRPPAGTMADAVTPGFPATADTTATTTATAPPTNGPAATTTAAVPPTNGPAATTTAAAPPTNDPATPTDATAPPTNDPATPTDATAPPTAGPAEPTGAAVPPANGPSAPSTTAPLAAEPPAPTTASVPAPADPPVPTTTTPPATEPPAPTAPYDHLLIGTSLPWLLPHHVHDAETWNAALCRGDRGARWARFGEDLRRRADLEHWAAFPESFDALAELIAEAGTGTDAPASVCVLSGDVHHAYVAEPTWHDDRPDARILQLTCSPVHNSIPLSIRLGFRFGWSGVGRALGRRFARHGRRGRTALDWRKTGGPWFGNQLMTLTLRGRSSSLRLEQARAASGGKGSDGGEARLETVTETVIAP